MQPIGTLDQLRAAVVLQATPYHGLARAGVDSRVAVVVLQRSEISVVVGPAAAGRVDARRPREDAAVVADPQRVAGDRRGVLVGVRRVRAAAEIGSRDVEALQRQVPVRRRGDPSLPRVRALVDLLEARIEVTRIRGINGEELVVPGLNAGLVAGADRTRLLRGAAVHEYRRTCDLRERTVDVAGREIDACEAG